MVLRYAQRTHRTIDQRASQIWLKAINLSMDENICLVQFQKLSIYLVAMLKFGTIDDDVIHHLGHYHNKIVQW